MPEITGAPFAFPSADGKAMLEGFLHQPVETSAWTPALIVCHGRYNTMHLPLLRDLCHRAVVSGMRAVRFNFRYVTAKTSPSPQGADELDDLAGALAAVNAQFGPSPGRTYLAGKSLGAIVAGHVAANRMGLGGFIALGYPLHGPNGAATGDTAHFARLGCPALFVIGDRDPYCRPDRLKPLIEKLPVSSTLQVIAGGDHSFHPADAADTSDKYLPQAIEAVLRWLAVQIGD